ncbi:hypothetical protein HYZ78_02855 [Candidatus Microgenomates bacterium]|nr:hypothetical protein [Candidatus Microgenomates bacterium]
MKFRIDEEIFRDFDHPFIGVIVACGVDNHGTNPEIAPLLRAAEAELKKQFEGVEVTEHHHIVPWREAYQKFGAKPREFRCSAEALSRIVLRGNELRNISKLVDVYNYISIKYILPVGGEDIDRMQGDLVLTYATGDEPYSALGQDENDPPQKGEVVYKDDLGVLCRRWNWREGDRTKLTEDTTNAVLVIESLSPIPQELAQKATNELAELVKKYCGGEIQVHFLDENNREADL